MLLSRRTMAFMSVGSTALVCAPLIVSCGGRKQAERPLPPPPYVVNVTMNEYRFDYDDAIPAGRVVFKVFNGGSVPHRLSLFPLAEGVPPIEMQLKGSERRIVEPLAGINTIAPGALSAFAVDLDAAARYALVCFLVDDFDQETHARKGMNSEFRTPGATTTTTPLSSLPTASSAP